MNVRVAMMLLPGIAFWAHLFLWFMGWSIPSDSSENWWPVLIQIGIFFLCAIFFLIGVTIAVRTMIGKRPSGHWWVVALVNSTPVLGFLLLRIVGLIYGPGDGNIVL